MGLWKHPGTTHVEKGFKMMELYIETLTGTAFELRVSPYETVQDVKARIQKLEGIPMSQQHLIWQTQELEDDYSLQDYAIHDGCTLKLVLTMRGGPINTRRVPVEDTSLREMAEYFSEANRDDVLDKLPGGSRPFTVILYKNGDQLNVFRVVDREVVSPTSESLSGASMYNLYDDDDEDVDGLKEKIEDNDKTRSKMKLIRSKIENMVITKKPKPPVGKKPSPPPPPPPLVPHPPASGRPHSMSRLRRLPAAAGLLNRNTCLPPVGKPLLTETTPLAAEPIKPSSAASSFRFAQFLKETKDDTVGSVSGRRSKYDTDKSRIAPLSSVKEDEPIESEDSNKQEVLEALLQQAKSHRKWDYSADMLLRDSFSARKKSESSEVTADVGQSTKKTLEPLWGGESSTTPVENGGRASSQAGVKRQLSLDALADSLNKPPPSAASSRRGDKAGNRGGGGGVILESLNPTEEMRVMSGLLTTYVQSATKSRDARRTPDSRLLSGRGLQRLGSGGRLSPRGLAPMKHKKKATKRCFLCGKKTGLATSYQCRCGENYCVTHRYAEAHNCTFDYKSEGRKLLQQNNPVVTAPKLPKI